MANTERIKYKRSPLVEVIFQLRFPTILSINSTQPAEFQDKIRELYPMYKEEISQENQLIFTPDGRLNQVPRRGSRNYSFISQDGKSKVKLTSSFVSLSTLSYTQWEDFNTQIRLVVKSFEEVYKPPFYTRVGLRYVNIIQRKKLGLENEKWTELIKPHVLGIITSENVDYIGSFNTTAEFKLPDKGIRSSQHFSLVNVNNEQEVSFLMECDHFKVDNLKPSVISDIIEELHNNSRTFIQTSITDTLHNAMGPIK